MNATERAADVVSCRGLCVARCTIHLTNYLLVNGCVCSNYVSISLSPLCVLSPNKYKVLISMVRVVCTVTKIFHISLNNEHCLAQHDEGEGWT